MKDGEYQYLFDFMTQVLIKKKKLFSGLGVIFYTSTSCLPIISLRGDGSDKPSLPIRDLEKVVETLAEISEIQSVWHDGFHLVDWESKALTHISQYVAPQIDPGLFISEAERPSGARQMTALLVSRLHCVSCVALLSVGGEILFYENGALIVYGNA